jgi:hypothetical protein
MQTHEVTIVPRWANLPKAEKYSGLGVRVLEKAITLGTIRSSLVHFPGAKRGRRLIDLRSLDAWIESGIGSKAALPYLVRNDRKGNNQ